MKNWQRASIALFVLIAFWRASGQEAINAIRDFVDIATPSNPSSGRTRVYSKSGALCSLSPAGVETCTGAAGGSGAGPGASAHNNTNQTFTSGSGANLNFQVNDWDTCSACTIHSASVNVTRFTAPTTGYYLASCSISGASSSTPQNSYLAILVNGSGVGIASNTWGTNLNISTTGVATMSATDYMECNFIQFTGSNMTVTAAKGQLTKLSGTL